MDNNIKGIIRDSYNKSTKIRDRNEIEQWKIKELEKVLSYTNDMTNYKLLDLGAGSGIYGKYLKDRGMDVTGVDLASSMVNLCKEKGLNAYVMDFYDLDFEENSFDIIWSLNTLLHVPKKSIEVVLKNVKRVLKPNGLFYLGLYGGEDFEGIWKEDFYEPKRFFSFYKDEKIKAIVEKHFKVDSFQSFNVGNNNKDRFQSILARNV